MRTSEVMALAESTAGPAKDTPAARMPAATSVASFWATYERARGSACGSRGVGEVWGATAGGRGAKKAAASWFKRRGSFRGPGPAVAAEKERRARELTAGLVGWSASAPKSSVLMIATFIFYDDEVRLSRLMMRIGLRRKDGRG